jgi:hypothetical protein
MLLEAWSHILTMQINQTHINLTHITLVQQIQLVLQSQALEGIANTIYSSTLVHRHISSCKHMSCST